MANLDNNMNINSAGRAYAPNFKKNEDVKSQVKLDEEMEPEVLNDGVQAADSYGRILVKQSGKVIDNPEMVKCVQDAIDFYVKNSDIAQKHVKNGDLAYQAFEKDGDEHAYEDMCCISCDAAYSDADK